MTAWGSWRAADAGTTTPRSSDARSTTGWWRRVFPPAAADQGAALHFASSDSVAEVVASREGARAYRVERRPDGAAIEHALPTRYLW
jgi:hypothetical protein